MGSQQQAESMDERYEPIKKIQNVTLTGFIFQYAAVW